MSNLNLIPALDEDYEKVMVNSNNILYVIEKEEIIYRTPMYEFKIIGCNKKFFAAIEILDKYFMKG